MYLWFPLEFNMFGRLSHVSLTVLLCLLHFAAASSAETVTIGDTEEGIAAYYSNVFQGRTTASGDRYDKNALTAAHNTYPFGTRLKVTNLVNNKTVNVRINDRGPATRGRIIDLSRRAAEELGFIKAGLAKVRLEVVQ